MSIVVIIVKKQQFIQIIIFLVTVFFSFINLFLLPDMVAVQWNSGGASNFVSKNLACIIPIGVNLVSLVFWRYSYSKYNMQIESSSKIKIIHKIVCTLFSLMGVIINVLFLTMNG